MPQTLGQIEEISKKYLLFVIFINTSQPIHKLSSEGIKLDIGLGHLTKRVCVIWRLRELGSLT